MYKLVVAAITEYAITDATSGFAEEGWTRGSVRPRRSSTMLRCVVGTAGHRLGGPRSSSPLAPAQWPCTDEATAFRLLSSAASLMPRSAPHWITASPGPDGSHEPRRKDDTAHATDADAVGGEMGAPEVDGSRPLPTSALTAIGRPLPEHKGPFSPSTHPSPSFRPFPHEDLSRRRARGGGTDTASSSPDFFRCQASWDHGFALGRGIEPGASRRLGRAGQGRTLVG
ncbi:hypothetical protein GGR56DRAFT_441219 [Xylariaceae sp. FL0804]|nr:hypothetical protein GGR56DRAFT_441219 [Xylariaceae sp. FL0804]